MTKKIQKNMKKRDIRQCRLYAEQRMVVAIDRFLEAKTTAEMEKASKWARAWRDFSEGSNLDAVSLMRNHTKQV